MKTSKAIVLSIALTLILSILAFQNANATGTVSPTAVAISPSSPFAKLHQSFSLNVSLYNASDLYGVDLDVGWNSSVLQATKAESWLDIANHSDGVLNHKVAVAINNLTQDDYHLVGVSTYPSPSFNGSGRIAVLTFNVIGIGSSEIKLTTMLSNTTPAYIPHEDINAYYSPIQITANPSGVNAGQEIRITGALTTSQANTQISIMYRNTTDTFWKPLATVDTDSQGNYTYDWVPNTVGSYDLEATATLAGSIQTSATLTVTVNYPIQISATPSTVNVGQKINIAGALTTSRASVPVAILYKNATDTVWHLLATVITGSQGNYTYDWVPKIAGSYDLEATATLAGSIQTSMTVTVTVNSGAQVPWIYIGIVLVIVAVLLVAILYYWRRKR